MLVKNVNTLYFKKEKITFNFIYQLVFKWTRPTKKVHHEIELTFNFIKEIPFKLLGPNTKSNLKSGINNNL